MKFVATGIADEFPIWYSAAYEVDNLIKLYYKFGWDCSLIRYSAIYEVDNLIKLHYKFGYDDPFEYTHSSDYLYLCS